MSVANRKVAILVHNHFEQSEFEEPLQQLKDAGAAVTIIATDTKDLQAMQHTEAGDKFTADVLLAEADSNGYDALVLPGGTVNADKLRMNELARRWVGTFTDDGKLIAAICHAPWLLVSADLLEGRRLTSYYTLQDDIRNAGAEWIDQPVVIDGDLITSRQPGDIQEFIAAIEHWFEETKIVQNDVSAAAR